ncbi:MAG: hypothetical protein VXX58_07065 [Pseudomonadota bacterium]|nr:hypothetical protein [Pseudomonadota bacterium]
MTSVFIPTTQHPVEIISLTEEHSDIQSVICITNTFNALPVSTAYHGFVRRPTGIIQKLTGIPSFRADVSGPIDQGDSWQLSMLIAHRLHHNHLFRQAYDSAGNMAYIWASGQVDINQNVSPVQHIAEKFAASQSLFEDIRSRGGKIHIVLHPENMTELKHVIPEHMICHSVSDAADIDQLLSDERFRVSRDQRDNNRNDPQPQRPMGAMFRRLYNKHWKRRMLGYGLTISIIVSLQQMIPWHPIHAAMEMEKSGSHVELIRMLKSYRQDNHIVRRWSFLYFEEAYLKQKSQTLINQLDMQLVWAVADNNSASCDHNQMRWHRYQITDTELPALPRQRCQFYLEIQNNGSDRLAIAVAIHSKDGEQTNPILQPAQTELAPTEHIRHPINSHDDKPLILMISASDHLTMNWYRWFKRWANRPLGMNARKSLTDTGIGVYMATQNDR